MRLLPRLVTTLIIVTGLFFSQSIENEVTVNTYTINDQLHPAIASDKTGRFIIVWESQKQDENLPGIYAQIFQSDGTPYQNNIKINSMWALHEYPAVALGEGGNIIVTWTNHWIEKIASAAVCVSLFNKEGSALTEDIQVNEYEDHYQGLPDIATDKIDSFIVTWQSWGQDKNGLGIFASKFDPSATTLKSEFQVNTKTLNDQIHPAIAMDPDGRFVIVWTDCDSSGQPVAIYGQHFTKEGEKIGPEIPISVPNGNWKDGPDIAMTENGNFVVCWHAHSYTADTYDIFARLYWANGAPHGQEFRVNTQTEGWQTFPSIDIDPEGRFVIIWESKNPEGDSLGIFGQVFEANGLTAGPEFRVNKTLTGIHRFPDVRILNNQKICVVWQHRTEDSGWDIKARTILNQLGFLDYLKKEKLDENEKNPLSHRHTRPHICNHGAGL